MWSLVRRLRGNSAKRKTGLRNFYTDVPEERPKNYRPAGQQSIRTSQIVGSVNRADELNSDFVYRDRRITGRYNSLDAAMLNGTAVPPINVIKYKERPDRTTSYYVVDGHHRVAIAKKRGLQEMNAVITEVDFEDDDQSENASQEEPSTD